MLLFRLSLEVLQKIQASSSTISAFYRPGLHSVAEKPKHKCTAEVAADEDRESLAVEHHGGQGTDFSVSLGAHGECDLATVWVYTNSANST